MTPDQQAFEDRCWEHYLAERARRTIPGDVEGEPTREGLFWRREGGLYGVLAFNTAWMAYQWGMQAVLTEPVCFASVNKQGDVTSTVKHRDSWRTVPLYTYPAQHGGTHGR